MRRATVLAAGLILLAGVAYGGDYHFGANLRCSDCHVMHASLTHNYSGGGTPITYTPSEHLTKGGVNPTCLQCHDGGAAPDVYGLDDYGTSDRAAGALNDSTAPDGYEVYMGHTLGAFSTAPGETGSFVPDAIEGLRCTDCHHPHGYHGGATDVYGNDQSVDPNGNYRNLSPQTSGISISYTKDGVGPDLTRDVWAKNGAFDYEAPELHLTEPVPSKSGFGTWCGDCHVNFHGEVADASSIGGVRKGTSAEKLIRHPAADVNIGGTGPGGHSNLNVFAGKAYRVRVMSPQGDWGSYGTAWASPKDDVTPTCLSCHKAHGNGNPFGLIYAKGAAILGEDGDGTAAKDLCRHCHVQGG